VAGVPAVLLDEVDQHPAHRGRLPLPGRPRPPEKGETATLRWVLVHMVEEYARHAGHADLIRQSVDGATDV
jgi:hypothetical protein